MSATETPFNLVEIKLAAPFTRPGTVAKTQVIERLRTTSASLAVVVAPAGYGKTTLLARWAESDPRPFAWVALDGRDDDATLLLRYIAAAIHRVNPLPPEVFDALSGRDGAAPTLRLLRLGTALATLDRPLVLVLDDLHAIRNPSCLDALAELVEHVPEGSLIAVASREEPTLPVTRWREQGKVQDIGVSELRFDEHEAGLLLEAAGVELEPAELSRLTGRTEGWPAALYLAALSIDNGSSDATGIEAFSGDDQFLAEYLHSELLARLPVDEARFLRRSSVLGRMCGGLCDAVLDTAGSAHTLESLEASIGFVVRLDLRGKWYRFHHLFGQLLRNELERTEPELVADLNRRAMSWCIANDLPEEAIVYARAAGELNSAADLLEGVALPLYFDGRLQTVEEWLGWFGEHELVQHPALAVYGAWIRVLTGRPEDAERLLAVAEQSTTSGPLADGSVTIEPWIATLRAHLMRDGVERALAEANLALDRLAPGSWWIPGSLRMRGVAHGLLGANDRETEDLKASVAAAQALGGGGDDVSVAQALLALRAANREDWGEAAELARSAQALVDGAGLGDYPGSAIVHAATARIALHENRHEEARAALARVHRLRPLLDHGFPWLTVEVGLELVRAHLALGEAAAARTVLTETEQVLELRPDLGSLVDQARELHERVDASHGSAGAWAMSLTAAELRLLPYLATHLTIPEIASRLYLSRNTVKSEVVSVYRKLGASSRSEAIERAIEVGLLEDSILTARANFTLDV